MDMITIYDSPRCVGIYQPVNRLPLTIQAQGSETGGAAEHGVRCAAFPLPVHPPLIDVIQVGVVELGLDRVVDFVVAGHCESETEITQRAGESETMLQSH